MLARVLLMNEHSHAALPSLNAAGSSCLLSFLPEVTRQNQKIRCAADLLCYGYLLTFDRALPTLCPIECREDNYG